MNTIFNFGDVHKSFEPIARELLRNYETISVPITNIKVYKGKKVQIVSACYGLSLTYDTLSMMKNIGMISENDSIIFLGSMGSIDSKIKIGDFCIPKKILRNYLDKIFNEKEILVEGKLQEKLENKLESRKIKFIKYTHAISAAVFDPNINHEKYTHKTLTGKVSGFDLESFGALYFCKKNKLNCGLLFYCADDPSQKIHRIPKEEFDRMAAEKDKIMNRIAFSVLK